VAQQLGAHPALVDNQQFMATHPELREYFAQHPAVRENLKEHPYRFMGREDRLDGKPNPIAPVANADRYYLDKHPMVARQLDHNPRLIDNPARTWSTIPNCVSSSTTIRMRGRSGSRIPIVSSDARTVSTATTERFVQKARSRLN
jgi:hypothetical protein